MADIATPHIAGYSYEGKIKATEITYLKMITNSGKYSNRKTQHNFPET
jgi:hypothetical protein